jgi:hypothetical protein
MLFQFVNQIGGEIGLLIIQHFSNRMEKRQEVHDDPFKKPL